MYPHRTSVPRATLVAFAISAFTSSAVAADGEWRPLFDGKTLTGWQANESPQSWIVEDGAIVTMGSRSHLFYVGDVGNHDFKNFEFSAKVMTTPGANSGIYFHTRLKSDPWPQTGYEAQVVNSSREMEGGYVENKMTGSIYAVRNTWRAPAKDNTWFEYRIKVSGKTIQTFIDGELICEYTEGPSDWRANDKPGRHLASGTFALQCHDPKSVVRYRDLKVRILPDDAPSLGEPIGDRGLDELISRFSDQNLPLIDLGIDQATGESAETQANAARSYGMTLGYAFPPEALALSRIGASGPVVLFNDRDTPPSVDLLKAAKANKAKVAFSSGGVSHLDPDRLRKRLEAIRAADLGWRDVWIPGK